MVTNAASVKVTWEKLPDNYLLPDDPVDNRTQPMLAMALTEGLSCAGKLSETTLSTTNYGICATVDDKIVVKAPDWCFVPHITVSPQTVERSYTPNLEGDSPAIVMEFLSHTDGGEYSAKPSYPPGKWFYYEQILKVPTYVIFEPDSGDIEVYRLDATGTYRPLSINEQQHYWIPELELFLGVWYGTREDRTGYWLRWWNELDQLVLWTSESLDQERQRAEQERQRAEQERQRAEQERQRAEQERERSRRLEERLRSLGIDPDQL